MPPEWHLTLTSRAQVDALALLLKRHPGTTPVILHYNGWMRRPGSNLAATVHVRNELLRIFGVENVREEQGSWPWDDSPGRDIAVPW